MNELIQGDNLEIMRKMESESIVHDGLESSGIVEPGEEGNPNKVNFYVGQLANSRISLKDEFHAKSGCIFHAKTKGHPIGTFGKKSIPIEEEKNIILNTGNNFSVFPNPAKDVIKISFFSANPVENAFVLYEIYSLIGERILDFRGKVNETVSIPIQNI